MLNYKQEAMKRRDIQIDYISLGAPDSKKISIPFLEKAMFACNTFGRHHRKVISFGWQKGLSCVLEIYHVPKTDVDDYGRLSEQGEADASPEFYQQCVRRGVISSLSPTVDTKESDTDDSGET